MRCRTGAAGAAGLALMVMAGCNLGSAPVSHDAPGRDVAAGDIDGDGDKDLVSVGWGHVADSGFDYSDSAVFVGDGTGQFSVDYPEDPTGFDTMSGEVELADLDGDGDLDLLRTVFHAVDGVFRDELGVQLGDGNGGFAPLVIMPGTDIDRFTDLRIGDVNGDGLVDAVLLGNQSTGLHVFLGDGAGGFSPVSTFFVGAPLHGALALADMDGDGDLDIVSTGQMTVEVEGHPLQFAAVYVMAGDGNGQFTAAPVGYLAEEVSEFPDGAAAGLTVADLDGDGRPDVATATRAAARVLQGRAGGTLGPPVPWATGLDCFCSTETTSADIDGDGHVDVLVGDGSGLAVVLFGDGVGGFPARREIGTGAWQAVSMLAEDLTDDGQPDLVVAGSCLDNTTTCTRPPTVGVSINSLPRQD